MIIFFGRIFFPNNFFFPASMQLVRQVESLAGGNSRAKATRDSHVIMQLVLQVESLAGGNSRAEATRDSHVIRDRWTGSDSLQWFLHACGLVALPHQEEIVSPASFGSVRFLLTEYFDWYLSAVLTLQGVVERRTASAPKKRTWQFEAKATETTKIN